MWTSACMDAWGCPCVHTEAEGDGGNPALLLCFILWGRVSQLNPEAQIRLFFLNLAPRIPWVHSLRLELFVGSCAHWHLHGLLGCGFWSSCLLGKCFQCYAISLAWSLAFNQHWLILTWTVSQDVCLMLAHDETEIKYFRKKWHSNHSVFCCILPGVPDIVLLLQVILAPVSFIIIIKCQIT